MVSTKAVRDKTTKRCFTRYSRYGTIASMDKLKQIETFIEVAEKGSLARAGLSQKISPAMLGRRIDALEKRLGVKLMHRTTRHLTLTEEGVAYLDHCTRLMHELDKAEQQIGEGR